MNYKYKKGQLFGKTLKVPKYILNNVYNCTLSLKDFVEYELYDKIPIACLEEKDRNIAERFGIEKIKNLDFELLDKHVYYSDVNFRNILMEIDPSIIDLNVQLYELSKDLIKPSDYSSRMKKVYSDRLFDLLDETYDNQSYNKRKFNSGDTSIIEIVKNWDFYKDKDLSYCLLNDKENKYSITDNQLKQVMNNYQIIIQLLLDIDIYSFISGIVSKLSIDEQREHVKHYTDSILKNKNIEFTNEQYKELFQYSSLEEFLGEYDKYYASKIIEELRTLPQNYIFNSPIPFRELLNLKVLCFVAIYGLKNIVDFDNDCGHYFTRNNCEMLRSMFSIYCKDPIRGRAINEVFDTRIKNDINVRYIDRPHTKEEFYEAMRRMIIYGPPSTYNYPLIPDYRFLTGEFREKNDELFISEMAPEKLKNMFYTKSITPKVLFENPKFIKYLNDKNIVSCLKAIMVEVKDADYSYKNLYDFIISKANFADAINLITNYCSIIDILVSDGILEFSINDSISEIQNKLQILFKKSLIEKRIAYPKIIPQDLLKQYPALFLSNDAPQELKDEFYSRTINANFILSNPNYKKYLEDVDIEIIFKCIPIYYKNNNNEVEQSNLINIIKHTFDEDSLDIILAYNKYIEAIFEDNQFRNFNYKVGFSKDEFLDELDSNILQIIIAGKMKYDENMPAHFKKNYPTLFLNQNVSQDIKNKFYNRELTIEDFNSNPNLLDIFENTNVVCGFSENMSWLIPYFNNISNSKSANLNRLKIISAYSNINDVLLQEAFKEYAAEVGDDIINNIEYTIDILSRLAISNSNEIFSFRKELSRQLLSTDNPLENLNKIEDIFLKNNIPVVGKLYSCFEILYPSFDKIHKVESPTLNNTTNANKRIIVFTDLIKAAFGSNNRSIIQYLNNIEKGNNIYESIKCGKKLYSELDEFEKEELSNFSENLIVLYNNTIDGKNNRFIFSGDAFNDIVEVSKKISPNGTLDYNLADRIIKMFCGFAGVKTLEQAKEYINKKINYANTRNINASKSQMEINKGDFVKGVGHINYLRNILQNGSLSKEFLGASATSDSTPLDTDVAIIMNTEGTVENIIQDSRAGNYGPIYFVLKNDERFITTRTNNGTLDIKRDLSKMEVFYAGVIGIEHYAIRTGFPSSEINYIYSNNYSPEIGLEIAMNGFYIPVADKTGKIVFTPNDYKNLREKMSGLSYFNEPNYKFSENLITEETDYLAMQIEQNNYDVQVKRMKINEIIKRTLNELGLHLKTVIDGDLTEGTVELIDTGSTGRGTNNPGDGDFDFMMRLDKSIMLNQTKLNELKQSLLKNLGNDNSPVLTNNGDFRLKNVQIDSETIVDIDITFTEKTDRVVYSTDMALQDKLTNIKRISPENYKYVVANILLAKQVLKQAEVYKPDRGDIPQGGLGGVGIENWILQNGGSFIDAAKDFVEAANGKSFDEFKSIYQIWDFGDNHLAERRGQYCHDNFISNNMSEAGYKKMVQVLNEYLKTVDIIKSETEGLRK